jgi:hypothetical protein
MTEQRQTPVATPDTAALQALARAALPATNPGPTITQPVDVDDMDVSAPENTPSQHSPPTKVVRDHDKNTTRSPSKHRSNRRPKLERPAKRHQSSSSGEDTVKEYSSSEEAEFSSSSDEY